MLEVKFFGKEPEVILVAAKNEKGATSIEVKGSTGDILVMLTALTYALKKRIPSSLVDAAVRCNADELFDKTQETIIDMEELRKQAGK